MQAPAEGERRQPLAPNAFTVDVEEYFQVSAFEEQFPREVWDSVPSRLERSVDAVLEIAASAGVRGTFFILGWIARRHPHLVRRIVDAGHEAGCHGLEHRLAYRMDPWSFRADLREALRLVEDATGAPCHLYRAPSFSITRASLWALPILAEEGIRIDSSVFPIRHDRYGIPGAPAAPFRPLREHPDFVEFPPSTITVGRWRIPCAGGGYLRLFPLRWTRAAIRRIQEREGHPALLFVHPWEFDPEQPLVGAGRLATFRHRVGLKRSAIRLADLLGRFEFAPLTQVVASRGGPSSLPILGLGPARS